MYIYICFHTNEIKFKLNVVHLSEITTTTLTFRGRTTDITYSTGITLFLHATSGALSLTAAFFLRRLLAFCCFKCYLGSLSGHIPLKHTEQDQTDAKWLEKKFFSDVRVEEQVEA